MNAKSVVLPLIFVLGAGFTTLASAAGNDCNAKRAAIEKEIQQAQKYGNVYKLQGLKKALREVNAHCTDASLIKDAQKKVDKLQGKLRDKQEDVREVQADLREAQAKGDLKKVAKYQKKLREKQADVKEIQADLRQAQAELSALKG